MTLRARLRSLDAALPPAVRYGVWAVLGALLTPWVLRLYAAYWDAAWGRPGGFLETFLPRVGPGQ